MAKETSEDFNILQQEIDAFMEQLPEMIEEHEDEWTVIKGDERLGFWHCEKDALKHGISQHPFEPILVRQVSREYQLYGREGRPLVFTSPFTIEEGPSEVKIYPPKVE